MKLETLVF